MQKQLFIDYINALTSFTKGEIDILLPLLEVTRHKKNTLFVSEGKIAKQTSFILSGSSVQYHTNNEGNDKVFRIAVEGYWSGDFESFVNCTPSLTSVKFLEDSSVITFSLESSKKIINRVPNFNKFLQKSTEKAFIEQQHHSFVMTQYSAEERYRHCLKQFPDIEKRIPQYIIASYIGVTKQFLSKMRKEIFI